jgi:hypothetical protein
MRDVSVHVRIRAAASLFCLISFECSDEMTRRRLRKAMRGLRYQLAIRAAAYAGAVHVGLVSSKRIGVVKCARIHDS